MINLEIKESEIQNKVEAKLRRLNWHLDISNISLCNVYKERAKTSKEDRKLRGNFPNYILYKEKSTQAIATIVINSDIETAINKSIEYSRKIKCPIAFATDGVVIKSHHIKRQNNLLLNGEDVNDFQSLKNLLNFEKNGYCNEISTNIIKNINKLSALCRKFDEMISKVGFNNFLERINILSFFIFLRLLNGGDFVNLNSAYTWNAIKNKNKKELIGFLNIDLRNYLIKELKVDFFSKINSTKGVSVILYKFIKKLDKLNIFDEKNKYNDKIFQLFLNNYLPRYKNIFEFYTDRSIAKATTEIANPTSGESVYDGFAGSCGLLFECFELAKSNGHDNSRLIAGEISEVCKIGKMSSILSQCKNMKILHQDSHSIDINEKYDLVISHLPIDKNYSDKKYDDCDYSTEALALSHCLESIDKSKKNSRAVVLLPYKLLFKINGVFSSFIDNILLEYDITRIHPLNSNLFDDKLSRYIVVFKAKENNQKELDSLEKSKELAERQEIEKNNKAFEKEKEEKLAKDKADEIKNAIEEFQKKSEIPQDLDLDVEVNKERELEEEDGFTKILGGEKEYKGNVYDFTLYKDSLGKYILDASIINTKNNEKAGTTYEFDDSGVCKEFPDLKIKSKYNNVAIILDKPNTKIELDYDMKTGNDKIEVNGEHYKWNDINPDEMAKGNIIAKIFLGKIEKNLNKLFKKQNV